MHGVDMRKCKCYTSAKPPSHFCHGEWECTGEYDSKDETTTDRETESPGSTQEEKSDSIL